MQVAEAIWSPEQLAGHRRAAAVLIEVKDATFAHVRERLAAGLPVTECGVQDFMMAQFAARGMEADHPPIVGVNGHAADPHYSPRATPTRRSGRGDFLLMDLWSNEPHPDAIYGDITWVAYAGPAMPPRMLPVFEIVRQARDAAVAFAGERIRSGRRCMATRWTTRPGSHHRGRVRRPYFIHRTGHSIGTSGHGNGVNLDNLETQDRRRLMPGVGFSIEPGIYLAEERFGVRLEIDCYVAADDLEVTTLPMQGEIVVLQA